MGGIGQRRGIDMGRQTSFHHSILSKNPILRIREISSMSTTTYFIPLLKFLGHFITDFLYYTCVIAAADSTLGCCAVGDVFPVCGVETVQKVERLVIFLLQSSI
jgi:hypothetical protein